MKLLLARASGPLDALARELMLGHGGSEVRGRQGLGVSSVHLALVIAAVDGTGGARVAPADPTGCQLQSRTGPGAPFSLRGGAMKNGTWRASPLALVSALVIAAAA